MGKLPYPDRDYTHIEKNKKRQTRVLSSGAPNREERDLLANVGGYLPGG